MCRSYIDFAVTTSEPSQQPVAKLVFFLEETQREDFDSALNTFLKEAVHFSSVRVEGITVEWKIKDTPDSTWTKINENVIMANASAVISFLPSWKNQLLVNVLSKSVVPVIGMESLTEVRYNSNKVRKQTLKIYQYSFSS